MDPSLLDNVLIPKDFFPFIYHVVSYFNLHSIIASGLILAGCKIYGRHRQTEFFTAVDPMNKSWFEQEELDLTKPRHAADKQTWKISQDAVCWVDFCRAQRMGLNVFQTRSNAIILHDTLPPICIERVVFRKTEEVQNTTTSKSPRPAPTITLEANCQKDWNFEAAASSSSPIQSIQLARTVKPVILKSRAVLDQKNMEDVQKDNEEFDQACTEQPVVQNSGTFDFRIQGLLHSKVKRSRTRARS